MQSVSILGQGVVSPGGNHIDALSRMSEWPTLELPRPVQSHETTTVSKIDLQTLQSWRAEPRFRRATPISLFLAEAVSQAISSIPHIPRDRIGLVVTLFTCSVTYSRRFFQEIVEQGSRAASPMLFPETVFNSPASHVVAQLQLQGPTYSLLGDETAWISGLETAALWLELDHADAVVVVAAEELDAMVVEVYRAAGWIQKGMIPSEGAGALLLGKKTKSSTREITGFQSGHLYQSRSEFKTAERALSESLAQTSSFPSPWNPWTTTRKSPLTPHAMGASAAWQTILASQSSLPNPLSLPLYGCNHQAGAILFS